MPDFGEYELKIGRRGDKVYAISKLKPRFCFVDDTLSAVMKKVSIALERYEAHVREHPSMRRH